MNNQNSKLAVFLHGWGGTKRTWFLPINSLPSLFKKHHYSTLVPSLPERYISKNKDFSWYAEYLDQLLQKACAKTDYSEIVLVGYSMGGVLARHYLKSEFGTSSIKDKIKTVITIASPHHGTDVEILDIIAEFSQGSPKQLQQQIKKIATAPCYRQIKPDSEFFQKLNSPPAAPPRIKWHNIRTRGDKIVTPGTSSVLTGANNYFIDSPIIGHIIVRMIPRVHELIEQVLNCSAIPSGLQNFPDPKGCSKSKFHHWLPLKHWDTKTPDNKPRFLFECLYCGQATWHRD